MEPRATCVTAIDGSRLLIAFRNNEVRVFHMLYLFDLPIYQKLHDSAIFRKAYVDDGIVHWDEMTDLAPETAYYRSTPATGATR